MKNSGVEWIGEIPDGWEVSKIGQLYEERRTKVSDTIYPPLSVTMQGILPQLETAAKSDAHDDRKLVLKGDFAINSRSDRRGSCGISEFDGSVSLINTVLHPKTEMNPIYYNWLFHSFRFSDEYYKNGHGIVDDLWTTSWSEMKRIFIPLPPKSTQQRIASYLDKKCSKIEETIQKQQQVIEKLKAYKQALITEAVTGKIKIQNGKVCGKYESYKDSGVEWIGKIPSGWETPKIQYISTISSGTTPNRSQPKYWNGDVNWIKTGELQNNRLFEVEEKITQTAVDECSLQILPLNTVLIAMYGQGKTRGMTALLKTPSTTNQACAALIVNSKKLSSNFLWHCLIGAYNAIRADAEGSGQPNLNSENIKKFHIVLPSSVEEQECICNYLDKKCTAIDTAIEQKQKLIEKLTEYKKSLIYECVTGKKEI